MNHKVILLDKLQIGENLLKYDALMPDGTSSVFLKKGKSNKFSGDLFDTIELTVPESKSNTPFIKESNIICSRRAIAADYSCFEVACSIARFVTRNASLLDQDEERYTLMNNTMDALLEKKNATVIHLKFLFKFADMEGLPVRQEWIQTLSNPTMAKQVLSTEAGKYRGENTLVEEMRDSLISWLRQIADFYGLD